MSKLKIIENPLTQGTASYSTLDWEYLSQCWKFAYLTPQGSDEFIDESSSITHTPQIEIEKSWDEIVEEVLEDHAGAWERLAKL